MGNKQSELVSLPEIRVESNVVSLEDFRINYRDKIYNEKDDEKYSQDFITRMNLWMKKKLKKKKLTFKKNMDGIPIKMIIDMKEYYGKFMKIKPPKIQFDFIEIIDYDINDLYPENDNNFYSLSSIFYDIQNLIKEKQESIINKIQPRIATTIINNELCFGYAIPYNNEISKRSVDKIISTFLLIYQGYMIYFTRGEYIIIFFYFEHNDRKRIYKFNDIMKTI